jgi:hypothetical protein
MEKSDSKLILQAIGDIEKSISIQSVASSIEYTINYEASKSMLLQVY